MTIFAVFFHKWNKWRNKQLNFSSQISVLYRTQFFYTNIRENKIFGPGSCASELQLKVNCRIKFGMAWPTIGRPYHDIPNCFLQFTFSLYFTFSCNSLVHDLTLSYLMFFHIDHVEKNVSQDGIVEINFTILLLFVVVKYVCFVWIWKSKQNLKIKTNLAYLHLMYTTKDFQTFFTLTSTDVRSLQGFEVSWRPKN